MKNKKKKSLLIVLGVILVLILALVGAIIYISKTENNYSYAEKKWINENTDKTYDIYVETNLPIFSNNGVGLFYEYLKDLKKDTGLSFNITTTSTGEIELSNESSVDDNDIVVYKDHYVVVSKEGSISKLTDLSGKKVGVISSLKETITYYLTDYSSISYESYNSFSELMNAYNNNKIDYIIVPMYKYLNDVVSNEYEIIYHLEGLYSYYTISLNSPVVELNSIMKKFYNRWKTKSVSEINEHFLNVYYDAKNYNELSKERITNEDYKVGYISNLPYEGMIRNTFTGVTSTYLDKFSSVTGVSYEYIGYDSVADLSKALDNKEIDIMLNYYSLSNDKYTSSRNLGSSEYVVLASSSNNMVINSLYSLSNMEVVMLSNMNLKYNMASRNLFEIKDYSTIKIMSKNIDDSSIIIVDKEVYDYYKDSYLKNYSIRFMDTTTLNNSFLLNSDNSEFNELYDFFLSTLSSSEVKNESIENVVAALKNNKLFNFVMSNLFIIVVILLLFGVVLYLLLTKNTKVKKIKKGSRIQYFDSMTNLKNRTYLNENIKLWNSNKVYPQTIIVIDINKLKELNDKKGHEVGDKQIKSVASVLIKTQRDSSEIMRTDGDEFMIYLVGYEEKQVMSYIHKISKELNTSLYDKDYGVSIGFSMIKDELTSIDDAISEALIMIKKNKEGR